MFPGKYFPVFLLLPFIIAATGIYGQDLQLGAWLENDHIIVKCELPPKTPLPNALISVYASPSRELLSSGRTDSAGFYAFAVPEVIRNGNGLIIDVNAGNGLRRDWTMTAAELYAASSLTAGFDAENTTTQAPPEPARDNVPFEAPALSAPAATTQPAPTSGVTAEEVKNIVKEALEQQLSSIKDELKTQTNESFTWPEMLGGVGWVVGVLSILFYFLSRRKSD